MKLDQANRPTFVAVVVLLVAALSAMATSVQPCNWGNIRQESETRKFVVDATTYNTSFQFQIELVGEQLPDQENDQCHGSVTVSVTVDYDPGDGKYHQGADLTLELDRIEPDGGPLVKDETRQIDRGEPESIYVSDGYSSCEELFQPRLYEVSFRPSSWQENATAEIQWEVSVTIGEPYDEDCEQLEDTEIHIDLGG